MAFAGGTGTLADPYLVATAEQLNDVRNYLTSCFKQTADIDLSGYSNFVSIGSTYNSPFTGLYDGCNFKITNLMQNDAGSTCGLFAYVKSSINSPATLKNIKVLDAYIMCEGYSGILMGEGAAIIENCHVSGTIRGLAGDLGGLAGIFEDEDNEYNSHIYDSSADVVVAAENSDNWYNSQVGGLVGYLECKDIQRCYATGSVVGSYNVGGFAGQIYGAYRVDSSDWVIKDCYAACNVTGTDAWSSIDAELGGFTGEMGSQKIINCYSSSTVTNTLGITSCAGPFIGDYYADGCINCYYDSTLCSIPESSPALPKTTAELKMQETFTNWDFSNIWGIQDGMYPFLLNSPAAPPPPTYYDRIVIGGKEVELLNKANVGEFIVAWLNNHKVRTVDFYNNGVNIVYEDGSAKSLVYGVDELGQINTITDSLNNAILNVAWHNTEN